MRSLTSNPGMDPRLATSTPTRTQPSLATITDIPSGEPPCCAWLPGNDLKTSSKPSSCRRRREESHFKSLNGSAPRHLDSYPRQTLPRHHYGYPIWRTTVLRSLAALGSPATTSKPAQNPAPVGDDVRSLTSNPGMDPRLATSTPTRAKPSLATITDIPSGEPPCSVPWPRLAPRQRPRNQLKTLLL